MKGKGKHLALLLMMLTYIVSYMTRINYGEIHVEMLAVFHADEDRRATVSYGNSAGTVLIYLLSPVLIALWGWKSVFPIASLCAVVMLLAWLKSCPEVLVDCPRTERGRIGAVYAADA